MSVDTEFDLGSLTWVKGELDVALESARAALADWNGEDSNPLKAAAAYLHQVYGALQIVDLQGVSQVASETERLLAEMVQREEIRNTQSADTVLRAIAALKRYLDELMTGTRLTELKLASTLNAVVTRRGGEALAPSELFYPDTGVRAPRETAEMLLDEATRNRTVRAARLRYQKGLLQFLQNKEAKQGLEQMNAAITEIEKVAQGPAQYTFWWTAAALMETLRRDGVPTDFWLKRLCGRIDMQMRRLMEGSRQLADRLVRDVLFYVAKDVAPSGRSAQAQKLFELAHFFPAAEPAGSVDARVQLSLLRDNLALAKDHWIRYCAGRAESLQPFQTAALAVFEAATRLTNPDMQSLTRSVREVAKRLPGEADARQNEALQLEMATALLLAQNAAEQFAALGIEFQNQAGTQAMRLQAAIDPNFDISSLPDASMLDEISQAAQEKLVLAQVTQEIQANLNRVEEVLDRFFRDASDRSDLPSVPNLMKQILGALNILQLDVAAALVRESILRIEHFSQAEALIAPENLNWVAEALSTLSIYLDTLRHGRDDPQILTGLLAQPEVILEPEVSVEEQIVADIERIKNSVRTWGQPGDPLGASPDARAALKADLAQLARDADLVGDAALRAQVDAAMKALNVSIPGVDTSQLVMHAVQNIGAPPQSMQAPAPTAEAVRLAAASDEDIDMEMLSTFIEEAHEVLDNITLQIARLNVSPYDNEAFTAIRRSFHTLKGSGRMVGLMELAEPAWEIEQTLNVWLRNEKIASAEMLDFLARAGNTFQAWLSSLEQHGSVKVESGPLIQGARKLRGEPVAGAGAGETPPPKTEADVMAQAGHNVGKTEADKASADLVAESHRSVIEADADQAKDNRTDANEVNIGGHVLPAELFAIFSNEAVQRLADLNAALAEIARGQRNSAWAAFIRAAHTLAGISRTTGFTPLAEAAHQVEIWAGQWADKTVPLAASVVAQVTVAIHHLTQAVQGIQAHQFPRAMPEVAEALARTLPILSADALEAAVVTVEIELPESESDNVPEVAAETVAALGTLTAEVPAETTMPQSARVESNSPSAANAPTPEAHDELDDQLLPIFLEEAAELLPRIGSILRQWRSAPANTASRDELKRALHTLKGSARMAGAMQLGEAVHHLETQVIERGEQPVTPTYLDGLEAEYDHFIDIVESLKSGELETEAETEAEAETDVVNDVDVASRPRLCGTRKYAHVSRCACNPTSWTPCSTKLGKWLFRAPVSRTCCHPTSRLRRNSGPTSNVCEGNYANLKFRPNRKCTRASPRLMKASSTRSNSIASPVCKN
jgi:chemosensory pili system protein ChpA (sensor histidine kinase/response regulator)